MLMDLAERILLANKQILRYRYHFTLNLNDKLDFLKACGNDRDKTYLYHFSLGT